MIIGRDVLVRLKVLDCNLDCVFCRRISEPERMDERLTLEEVKDQLDRGIQKGCRNVVFSGGGETTFDPLLPEYIKYARDAGMERIMLETNGQNLSDWDYISTLKRYGLTQVSINTPSHRREIYEEITQIPGSFDRFSEALDNIARLDIDFVANMPVTSINQSFEHFLDLMGFLRSKGVNLVGFSPRVMRPRNGNPFEMRYLPRYEDAAAEIAKMEEYCWKERIPFLLVPAFSLPPCVYPGRREGFLNLAGDRCGVFNLFYKPGGCEGCGLYDDCVGISIFYERKYRFRPRPVRLK